MLSQLSVAALAPFLPTLRFLHPTTPPSTIKMAFDLAGDDLDFSAPAPVAPAASAAAPILVVGTQAAAADGSYQALITELSARGQVEMQMVDRIVDGGESRRRSAPRFSSFLAI